MTKKTIRAGIVGAGFAASFHYEAIQRVYGTNVEVQGVYALNDEQARDYAEKRGIRAYESLETLLDDVDVIHCCVLVAGHESVACAALARDKFAIVEKPLTGYCGDESRGFHGDTFPKEEALRHGLASVERMLEAERNSQARILYAEKCR